jgi:hypothetical protein
MEAKDISVANWDTKTPFKFDSQIAPLQDKFTRKEDDWTKGFKPD